MTRTLVPGRVAPWRHLPALGEQSAAGRDLPGGRPSSSGWLSPGGRLSSDRLVDGVLFVGAAGLGVFALVSLWYSHGEVLDWIDVVAGAAACVALWWRRAYPMSVFVLVCLVNAFSPLGAGAGVVVLCTAGARIRGRALIPVIVMTAAVGILFNIVNPAAGDMMRVGFPYFVVTITAFGWGLYLRARRELVASLRERADRLEADRQRAAQDAREAERRRIAREMHDVLAHRLSLLSVHAGALEFRPDASAAEIARAGAVIRASATAALGELRQVVTVLREDHGAAAGPPPPGLRQLAELLEESRSAGMTLSADISLPGAGGLPGCAGASGPQGPAASAELPEAVGRTVYRVVQEGLTNARKHAPGAPVEVTVTAAGEAVVAQVVSHRPMAAAGPEPAAPPGATATGGSADGTTAGTGAIAGAGAGLIGLAERVELVGGRLEAGRNVMGDFVLRATIPGAAPPRVPVSGAGVTGAADAGASAAERP